MKGGEGTEKVEKQEIKDASSDEGFVNIKEEDPKSAFEVMREKVLKFRAERDDKFKKMFGITDTDKMGVPKKLEKGESMTTTTMKKEFIMKEGKVVSQSGSTTVIKGGAVTGDTINQNSTSNITGDLDVNNNENTQRMLNDAF